MFDGLPLWRVAEDLSISITTAFRWRHRFLKAPTNNKPGEVTGIIEADEMFFWKALKENGPFITDQPGSEVASVARN
jgi:hypothetical protein